MNGNGADGILEELKVLGEAAVGLGALDAYFEDSPEWAVVVRGAFWRGAEKIIDLVLGDIGTLLSASADETEVISRLPEQHRHLYTPLFAKEFAVAAITLTAGITSGWVRPGCVAQEFVMDFIQEEMEFLAELYEFELPDDFIDAITETLRWGDQDTRWAYDPAMDGLWSDTSFGLGMANMDFSAWFKPFFEERDRLHPFLRD